MLNSSFIVIAFRWVNFVILLMVIYYLFKRYVKHTVDEAIVQKEMLLKGLEEQGYFLEGKINELDQKLEYQQKKNTELKEKINEWHEKIIVQRHRHQEEYQLYMKQQAQRIIIKNEVIEKQHCLKQTMPEILKHARQQLIESFQDKAQLAGYQEPIIRYLERKENNG